MVSLKCSTHPISCFSLLIKICLFLSFIRAFELLLFPVSLQILWYKVTLYIVFPCGFLCFSSFMFEPIFFVRPAAFYNFLIYISVFGYHSVFLFIGFSLVQLTCGQFSFIDQIPNPILYPVLLLCSVVTSNFLLSATPNCICNILQQLEPISQVKLKSLRTLGIFNFSIMYGQKVS